MNHLSHLINSKKWKIDKVAVEKITRVLEQFEKNYLAGDAYLLDIKLFPGYFTTLVFQLNYRVNGEPINYYVKLANLPKKWEARCIERVKYEFDCTQQIYDLFKDSNYSETVKPIALFEHDACFIMNEIKGKRLDLMMSQSMQPVFAKPTESLYLAMADTGRWLLDFQQKMPAAETQYFSVSALEERINRFLKSVNEETQGVLPHHFIDKLANRTRLALDDFEEEDFAITAKHNDYAPWNMMLGEKGIIAFDFADCEFDSKFYDVYHFTRALNSFKLKPIKNEKVIAGCKRAFLEGYRVNIPADHPTRIYFNIYFSIERVQMLLRAKKRNKGMMGTMRNIYRKRHLNWYLAELDKLANR